VTNKIKMKQDNKPTIGVVGPCGAGKTTLIVALKNEGYTARHIAQEHSYLPNMWARLVNPDILVYLNASYPVSTSRRKLDWTRQEYDEQLRRLQDARQHADLIIETDGLTPTEVLHCVLEFINLD
jgi:deoxyadenosine/deoxycytidine kinase